ncbi:S-adenosyl-L-methionine-dependent methyltransferase [Immersiella caudata]|uniref:S-adenosyl-L-methionine-dependent methyltransferase n=1 Tax=Immersiella caudata TaxID=314043 RepID=A0AA40C6P2_9PEZI|nr:S-adenosyl-L-methionine-dependent methyltransferase [Immersiella caudata]
MTIHRNRRTATHSTKLLSSLFTRIQFFRSSDTPKAPSSTRSADSYVLKSYIENGRTYHCFKAGKYFLPNDAKENERLDILHVLFFITFGDKLGLSPPNQPDAKVMRVLDVGTGTGVWALDYADAHPGTHIIATDLSAIQPEFVPSNVEFEIDDAEDEWAYSAHFDYIHARAMSSAIRDWPRFLQQCYNNLAPGGYTELQDMDVLPCSDDGTLTTDNPLYKCTNLMRIATIKAGCPFQDHSELEIAMKNAGFIDVTIKTFKWPQNKWPKDKKMKEMGEWNHLNLTKGIEGFCLALFTRVLKWETEEVHAFLEGVRKDLNDEGIHAYWTVFSLYGRKPFG